MVDRWGSVILHGEGVSFLPRVSPEFLPLSTFWERRQSDSVPMIFYNFELLNSRSVYFSSFVLDSLKDCRIYLLKNSFKQLVTTNFRDP